MALALLLTGWGYIGGTFFLLTAALGIAAVLISLEGAFRAGATLMGMDGYTVPVEADEDGVVILQHLFTVGKVTDDLLNELLLLLRRW